MAVPSSGAISMRGVAKERRYNDVGVDGYSSGSTVNLTNISMYDLVRGGNDNGSDFSFCPPMTNEWTVNSITVEAPYDPNLEQGSGAFATPYSLSEFRGHVGNRELGCVKINNNTNCYPVGDTDISVSNAGQSIKFEFNFNYTPKGLGADVNMEIGLVTYAGISSTSDVTGGSGIDFDVFSAAKGSVVRYLNIEPNSNTSERTFTLSIYITGSCYSSDNFFHTITITQAASAGTGTNPTNPKPGPDEAVQ